MAERPLDEPPRPVRPWARPVPVVACLGAVRDAAGLLVASPLLAAAAATFVG
ncbi:hypothetical protein CPER28S_01345 [Cellulomonas persica]